MSNPFQDSTDGSMVGKNDSDGGDISLHAMVFPSSSSSIEMAPSKGGRSIKPRGAIFTNLGDAHLAITARKASRATACLEGSSTTSSVAVPNPVKAADQGPTSQRMELAYAGPRANGRCLTPRSAATRVDVPREFPVPAASGDASSASTASLDHDHEHEKDAPNGSTVGESLANREPRQTGSTVGNIYKQYLPSTLLESTPSHSFETASGEKEQRQPESPLAQTHQDGVDANYKLGNGKSPESPKLRQAAEGLNPSKNRWKMYFSPGDAPKVPLPQLPPQIQSDFQPSATDSAGPSPLSPISQSPKSVSDSQDLLNGVSQEAPNEGLSGIPDRATYPGSNIFLSKDQVIKASITHNFNAHGGQSIPLGLPQSLRERLQRESGFSHAGLSNAGFSTGGLTSESDDDPFRYDRRSYNIFLQPTREREVSAALYHVDSASTPNGKGTTYSAPTTPTLERNIPPAPLFPADSPSEAPKIPSRTLKPNNPFQNKLQFYQPSAIQHNWDAENGPVQ
ncbi:hypothetical protein B0H63DRAFT_554988, partial [Podospora didyma]